MTDVRLRDMIGSFTAGRRPEPPMMPSPAAPGPSAELDAPVPTRVAPPDPSLFGPDRLPHDAFGRAATYAHFAEVALHRRAGTPLLIGVLGAPGSGKSFALARVSERLRALAREAERTADSPFVARVHAVQLDVASLGGVDAGTALAGALHASLRESYADLARELDEAARDPHVALRGVEDELDNARRRLDAERRALDETASRRARLLDAVLYEPSGSAVDAFARANRVGIERRFAAFGLGGGEALRSYKDHVLYAAGSGGGAALFLRSLWAYRGQARLLGYAVLLAALGIGAGVAIDTRETWLAALRNGPQAGAGLAGWLGSHLGLLATSRTAAFAAAGACLALDLCRALAFVRPITRGAALLAHDLAARRRDLDGLFAHQTKRVDRLDATVERLTREASAAERRLGARADHRPFATTDDGTAAPAFFAALAAATVRDPARGAAAPERLVLMLDGLDVLSPDRACAVLEALRRLGGAGMVALVALDPARHEGDALERWFDMPVRVAATGEPGTAMAQLLDRSGAADLTSEPDAGRSRLDEPLDERERAFLAAVAPLAGRTPRALRRFAGAYRWARLEGDAPRGALALTLAVGLGGTSAERELLANDVGRGATSALPQDAGPRLRAALAALDALGASPDPAALAAAARQAAPFAFAAVSGSR